METMIDIFTKLLNTLQTLFRLMIRNVCRFCFAVSPGRKRAKHIQYGELESY